MVMGKLSGRHAFRIELENMGYTLSDEKLNAAFERFKRLAEQKKEIFEEDIEAIISEEVQTVPIFYTLLQLSIETGTEVTPRATIELDIEGETHKHVATGDGPVDAVYRTIAEMVQASSTLMSYAVKAITGGMDAQGEVTVKIQSDGRIVTGNGASTDIIIASALAYLNALNKIKYWQGKTTEDLKSVI